MPPRRKRRRSSALIPPRGDSADPAFEQQRYDHGAFLLEMLLSRYALCKLNAAEFCILSYHAHLGGMMGGDFALYAYPPGKPEGRYQAHLDTVLPQPGPYYPVKAPQWVKGDSRGSRDVPTAQLWDRLSSELKSDPTRESALNGLAPTTPDVMLTEAYKNHPEVVKATEEGRAKPLPLAFYMDGVAFTSVLAGRSDTLVGMWIIH